MRAIPLLDTYGRRHRDLRISVTDRCNFRCLYCMPEEGMSWLARSAMLTLEEIERVARILVEHYGVDGIRLTGGEPTLRANLPDLVARLASLRVGGDGPAVDLSMTTNGVLMPALAQPLADAGLTRVNVSLDSLQPDRFRQITRRDALTQVLAGIDACLTSGLRPVKLNVVVVRGFNEDELVDFASFGRRTGVVVRFIEFMPLDAGEAWTAGQVVSHDEILDAIGAVYPLSPAPRDDAAPATTFRYNDGAGEIGVVASVTRPFCSGCDRIRLTAEGQLRNCLFAIEEFDLRALLRAGASDEALMTEMQRCVTAKWAGHAIGSHEFIRPSKSMSQIGG